MRILRVADIPDNRTGGMSRIMHRTGDIMRQLGHDVSYLFTEQLGSGWGKLRRFVIPWTIARLIIRQQRTAEPYDVVEIHEPAAAAYAFRRVLNKSLPPLAIISHGIEARGLEAKIRYRENKGIFVSRKQKYAPLSVVWQANYAIRHADHVLCYNSEDVSTAVAMRKDSDHVTCLPNGADEVFFNHGANRVWDPALAHRLLFVGTWLERKGIAELASAVSSVLGEFPDGRLTVAGCLLPPSTVRSIFPESLHGRIDVFPKISDDTELADVYRRHGIFVLPSFFEGQPLVMLEAAAMGLAIVSTNVCGMRDFVEPGRHGWLVPPGDADALTSALRRLMAHPEDVRTQGEAVRAKAQSYTWENAARVTLDAYERTRNCAKGKVAVSRS